MKYYILAPGFEATDKLLDDLKQVNNVCYIKEPIRNKFIRRLFYNHMYRFTKVPFKKFWKIFFEIEGIKDEEDTCIVYFNPWIKFSHDVGIMDKFRKKYKHASHVAYMTDIHVAHKLDIEWLKKNFDIVYIFDKNEASKLGVTHYPLVYSKVKSDDDLKITSDISFVGQAKDRYEEIIKVYEYLSNHGITCNFYIIGIDEKEQKYSDKIKYGGFISPEESFKYFITSKCVLELKVNNSNSYSDRVFKAIAHNKKVLSNNAEVKNNKFYNENMVQVYDNVNNIDVNFFNSEEEQSYNYNDEFSPIRLLEDIEDKLKISGGKI